MTADVLAVLSDFVRPAPGGFTVVDPVPLPGSLLRAEDDAEAACAWAHRLDAVIAPVPVRTPTGASLPVLYGQVLDGGEPARMPAVEKWWQGLRHRHAAGRRTSAGGQTYWHTSLATFSPLRAGAGWTHIRETCGDRVIEADVFRAGIVRPWFEPLLLRSHTWRMRPHTEQAELMLSDGSPHGANSLPRGALPLLPTSIVLARNVSLACRADSGAGTGADTTWAAIWLCDVVPKCPDPDPALFEGTSRPVRSSPHRP